MASNITNKMLFTKDKLQSRLSEISSFRYRDSIYPKMLVTESKEGEATRVIPTKNLSFQELKTGDKFEGRDLYLWIAPEKLIIPSEWKNKKIIIKFYFPRITYDWDVNFEGLVYINGKPYQGTDSYHPEIYLPKDCVGKELDIMIRFWSGFKDSSESKYIFETFSVSWLDEAIDDFYFIARNILETANLLEDNSPDAYELYHALEQSFKLVDWTVKNEEFYNSLYLAHNYLKSELDKMSKNSKVTVQCIGHTHIDVAWLWRLKHTREKAARSFSTVLRLMERYDDYIFLQTQPQLYEYIKQDYPEIYEEIKTRIKEGRWEANGAMWVEADCNISSGESLVRQILIGKKFFKEEFNVESDYLWLPDVFGYSWALPQILKKSGINTFMTTKISWNQYNKIPHDTFNWRGIDGTEILTHFINTPVEWASDDSFFTTYNGLLKPFTVKKIWDKYVDKNINQELLLAYGYGDGGGGVTRDMLENRRRLDCIPGLPQVKTQKASVYFNNLHERIDNCNQYVHLWDGELYLEYHRGTYTSQALIKKYNRKIEFLYRDVEVLGALTSVETGSYEDYKKLEEGWKIILRNQFHDIIPGSSVKEVYDDAKVEYQQAEKIAHDVLKTINAALIENDSSTYHVFNSASWYRNDFVYVNDMNENGYFIDNQGKILSSQRFHNGYLIDLENMKPLAFTTFEFKKDDERISENNIKIDGNSIETPFYLIELNENGHIKRLFDKEVQREVLVKGKFGNVIQTFEDRPVSYDAWDIDIFYQEKMYEVNQLLEMEVIENGNVCAVIRFKYKHLNSTITQDMILYTKHKRIDFKTTVDWQERRHLMKVAFPVEIRTNKATYDIQFGNVERPTHWNTSWDWARFEVVGHKWADLSEGGYGVSLMNDCKYGYDIKDQTMRLTLLKSANHPDPLADKGIHEFTYSLYPHKFDWKVANTEMISWNFNNPLTANSGNALDKSLFTIMQTNLSVDAIKKPVYGDDGIILRFHEYKGERGNIHIKSDYEIVSYVECDLMENPIGEVIDNNEIVINVNPYEIKTIKVFFK